MRLANGQPWGVETSLDAVSMAVTCTPRPCGWGGIGVCPRPCLKTDAYLHLGYFELVSSFCMIRIDLIGIGVQVEDRFELGAVCFATADTVGERGSPPALSP